MEARMHAMCRLAFAPVSAPFSSLLCLASTSASTQGQCVCSRLLFCSTRASIACVHMVR